MIALIVFYVVFLIHSVRLYKKAPVSDFKTALGLGLFLGSLNYVIAGLSTDSNVNTASLFWCCVGVGFTICCAGRSAKCEQ